MTSEQTIDYGKTLNLPTTDFPMKGGLPEREPVRLKHWRTEDLEGQILRGREGASAFILHDGPPYANGDIHLGHALNKILKDVIVRFRTLTGRRSYYVPGFDCHGLPIEQKVISRLRAKAREMSPIEIRRLCHEEATKWIGVQTEQFQRLGIGGDWEHAYRTLDPEVEVGMLAALRDMVGRGQVRRGFKPIFWDPVYRTALAEAEIEYEDHESDSIYVKFPLNDPGRVEALRGLDNVSLVIWTTTPWTLPANRGVCLHPDFEYVALKVGGEHYIVARELAESFCKACGLLPPSVPPASEGREHKSKDLEDVPPACGGDQGGEHAGDAARKTVVASTVRARDLERMTCRHPFFPDQPSLVVLGKHVTLEAGTGCVHTAPGHGQEDFAVGKEYGLEVFVPVDDGGRFTAEFPEMQGVGVFEANPRIVEKLREAGLLLGHKKIRHQYPHSWRSHKPIIFRATEQWFIELDSTGIREAALKAIDEQVEWIPKWGRDRIYNMVQQRPDWCLSRQRAWGVPIPAIRSKKSGESILDVRIIEKLIEKVATQGTDAWFTEPLESFWPEGFVHEPTGESRPEDFEKQYDIVDVWFDSGSTHIAVLEQRPGLKSPASLYLEGSDQHRGWFQSSLLIGIGTRGRPPFEAVLTHGFILDGKGEAMSKSKGNVISPQEIVRELGADGLRLWVISEDYRSDICISKEILKRVAEAYRRIRNTFRLLGNLNDFEPARDAVAPAALEEPDRWNLAQLNRLVEETRGFFERYEFHRVYHMVHNFCTVQLSALYLDVAKDRLYCSAPGDATRRAAQTACHGLLETLVRLMAPVLVFTADEAWEFGRLGPPWSVHLSDFPTVRGDWQAPDLEAKWAELLELRAEASRRLEDARRAKLIGHSLDASVTITTAKPEDGDLLLKNVALLKNLFIVSQVRLAGGLESGAGERWTVSVEKAPGRKCERCWMYDPQVGENRAHPDLCPRCANVIQRIT